MTLKQQIVEATDRAGRAVELARGIANDIREKQGKHESVGDLEASFAKASEAAAAEMTTLQRLNAEADLERHANELRTPTQTQRVHSLDSVTMTPVESRQAKRENRAAHAMLRQQQAAFARAGVDTFERFKVFREAHADAFIPYVTEGPLAAMKIIESAGFRPNEGFALLSTQGDLGGFLAPDDFQAEVLKDMAGYAVVRPNARVMSTTGPALVFPSIQSATSDSDIYTSGYVGSWRAEGYLTGGTAPTVQNQPKFGQTRIPINIWAPDAIEVSSELIQYSAANLDSILAQVIAETKGLDEDSAFFGGSGVQRPLGLLNTVSGTEITAVNSGHASTLTYGGLVDLFATLPAQYRQNAKWVMSSLTYGAILKLQDGQGMPILTPNSLPGQLWGKGIVFSEFMPEISANNMVIIFGDLNYYGVVDGGELRVQRLVERYAPNVGLLATARVGGQPLRTAGFRKQKVAA